MHEIYLLLMRQLTFIARILPEFQNLMAVKNYFKYNFICGRFVGQMVAAARL